MPTTLQSSGHRFVLRRGAFSWRHPTDIEAGDVDCTDMDGAAFEALVIELEAESGRPCG